MSNRLASETSPYLLQHAENPVDWFPWGPEALTRARKEDKPIFLSIGYSACHWCHVMEHESFENVELARQLNEDFVSIKVDREERPDLDQIYMNAVQLMTGRGGWPMSVFLTPELEPFYGGTYFPPTARMGMPGFDQVLASVIDAWKNRREEVVQTAEKLTAEVCKVGAMSSAEASIDDSLLHDAAAALERTFDHQHGGFGVAPKFPHPMDLKVLLRFYRREPHEAVLQMVTHSLDKMAAGGIYDSLGGGFHRYTVDERWLVPHFEKMLYDNALLVGCYLEGYQATGNQDYARVVRETLDYVIRDMSGPEGGFASTEDADSEGAEGIFYIWTPDEVTALLGDELATIFCYVYDVSDEGNFEGKNILNLPKTIEQCAKLRGRDVAQLSAELAAGREKLLAARCQRVRPARDDKILVSWNGLMIDSMAQASGALGEPRYLKAAADAANFILANVRRDDRRLLHSWRLGQARFDAYLDDYACLANGLVSLYEASFDERWIDEAVQLCDVMIEQFSDSEGGFFYVAADHEKLITRAKDMMDSAVPSGNSMAATLLVRLGKLTGRSDYLTAAEQTIRSAAGLMKQSATAAGQMLLAHDMFRGPTPEIVLFGDLNSDDAKEVLSHLRTLFLPNKVVAARDQGAAKPASESSPLGNLFAGKSSEGGKLALYVCENFACQEPAVGIEAVRRSVETLIPNG